MREGVNLLRQGTAAPSEKIRKDTFLTYPCWTDKGKRMLSRAAGRVTAAAVEGRKKDSGRCGGGGNKGNKSEMQHNVNPKL